MELSVRGWSAATSFIARWRFYSWGQHWFTVFLVFVCRYDLGGCWTVRDCMVVYRNTSHVRCQCQRLGTFGVLMDSSHREVSGLSQTWPIYIQNPGQMPFFSVSSSWRGIWRPWAWSPTALCACPCWLSSSLSWCCPACEASSPTPGASTQTQRRPCFCPNWCFSWGSIRLNSR